MRATFIANILDERVAEKNSGSGRLEMRRIVLSIAITLTWACSKSDVTIAPPRVPQGGRAVAIAVSQSDGKRLLVGSASGGLFRSFNGGVSFQHLDAFPTYAPLEANRANTSRC